MGLTSDGVHGPLLGRAPGKVRVANTAWAKRAGGGSLITAAGLATFADGSTVEVGSFWNVATFGAGEPRRTDLTSYGVTDIYVTCYAPDGSLAWAKRAGGWYIDRGTNITALADGSCVVTGYFQSSALFGAGEPNQTLLIAIGSFGIYNAFIARYASDGTLTWAKSAGGPGDMRAYAVTATADGGCVVVGDFYGTVTLGAGEPNQTTFVSAGNADIFVARYASNGSLAWAKRASGRGYDSPYAAASLPDGSVVVTGSFSVPVTTFGPGEPNQTALASVGGSDAFVARFAADGTLVWVKRAGGTSHEEAAAGVAPLADGSFAVVGWFQGTATFGGGELNETVLVSAGSSDVFVARYAGHGALIWVRRAGGADRDSPAGFGALSDGTMFVHGVFKGTATFGPGDPRQTVLTSVGSAGDLFLARYTPTADSEHRGGAVSLDVGTEGGRRCPGDPAEFRSRVRTR